MKIRLLFLLSFFCLPFLIGAQTYGNEWIQYNQTYYQFKIVNTGLYRLDYNQLISSGIPISTFNSSNIQIFGREKEIPLWIVDSNDNSIDSGDYVLFYAEKNDGWLDSTLYPNPDKIGNPAYSLYNDTIHYFFTWNNSTNNLRFLEETDVDFNSYSPAPFIKWNYTADFHSSYFEGENSNNLSSSFFNDIESFSGGSVTGPALYTFGIPTSTPYVGVNSPPVKLQINSFSSNNATNTSGGAYNHHLKYTLNSTDSLLFDTLFYGVKGVQFSTSFGAGSLNNGTTDVKWRNVGDLPVSSDNQGLTYLSLTYPKQTNLTGFSQGHFLAKNNSSASKIRLDLTWSVSNPLLFSFGDIPRKLNPVVNAGIVQALLPNNSSNSEQKLVFLNENLILNAPILTPVNGTGTFTNFNAVVPDSALLIVFPKLLESGAVDYKNYRNSMSGGSHQVILANIDELCLQFGGGIPKHINGVRRYAHFQYNQSVRKPAALFLLGKGIREAVVFTTTASGAGTRTNSGIYAQSLIPSFGQPSSDIAITASLVPNNYVPLIPTARISVTTNAELTNYLDKVIAYENHQDSASMYNSADKDWQKQVIHLAGGTTLSDQNQFQYYLESMENSITHSKFGGNVKRVYKTNSNPLSPAEYNEINARLSAGISLMTFFGHANSVTSGFEINLDDPANWNNQGKYPIVIANTCFNGNIFYHENLGMSTSEKFVRAQNSGAIGYLSTVYLGFTSSLSSYSIRLYKQMSKFQYSATIGKQIQATCDSLSHSPGFGGIIEKATILQMTFNGDPLLKLNWHTKPEIELLDENVTFGPNFIDLTTDSIEISITLKNLGRSITDTFSLEIIRNFPLSNIDSIYSLRIPSLDYTRTVNFKMPLQANIGNGINQFKIHADIPSFVGEVYDEFVNNQITKNLFINIAGIQPVSPTKYAVVPIDSVVLKASTINPLASIQTYLFEIDTTDSFNSPFKRSQNMVSSGGVIEAFPGNWILTSNNQIAPLICEDSMVYFWRVALSQTTLDWKESSFQYITGKTGWGQDHFFQFKENDFGQLAYDKPNRQIHFTAADTFALDCFVFGTNEAFASNQWLINNNQQEYNFCLTNASLEVCVVDPGSFEAWGTRWVNALGDTLNANHGFGNVNEFGACRPRVEKYFIFRQDSPSQLAAFQNMVLNEVPNGHYLLIYAGYYGAQYNLWNSIDSAGMYSTFAALGSDSINANRTNAPMAFFVKKGDTSTAVEILGQNANDPVHLAAQMIGEDNTGQETSTLIGPVANWNNFYWKLNPQESLPGDTTLFQFETFDYNQNYQATIPIPLNTTDSILNLENVFSANLSPYIKLRSIFNDSMNGTPAQLDRWHVLFDPLPEAALDGKDNYYWSIGNSAVPEGTEVSFAIDIRNIGSVHMDSLLVSYFIEDDNHVKHALNYPRQDSLRVNQTLRDTFTFSTTGYSGSNVFWVEVNPYVNPTGLLDQPEQFHFNNLMQIPFVVDRDDKNPILDVTFDGRHILNGDIVNPYSEILVTLKDDNPFLIMDNITDTALFGIYLTNPNGVQKRIPFEINGQTNMHWIPADAQNKRFKIMYPGAFDLDGKYSLLVQGADKSGNLSGDLEYKITFEIVREASITKMMNYPNPFSTSTRFVFTLTGTEIPDDMIIQIMTVTGKVVREITEAEFGPMYIGRNISEFSWNGTDEFGDQLANGVYLYKVRMKLHGENLKQRESGADTYFTKEFGKMYLLR
ncbi:MAG: C25 family cysteine peptidase [Crocinitomicaceae bacterium]